MWPLVGILALAIAACTTPPARPRPVARPTIMLAIHGGAGTIPPEKMTPEREAVMRADLERALRDGHAILAAGGTSLDAITRAIVTLEDSPYFNAGKGAVFTHDGVNELDAAIMSGSTLAAGAVAGVRTAKNPILLARAVMETSPHVMLVGPGADQFAEHAGVERVEPSYFHTDERWQQLQDKQQDDKNGTVGAVALDRDGALAAGTSTGGMTNKRWGRVGDSPLIGAGTYANATCAVSATGHGEHFIRHAVAYDICARVKYLGVSLETAAHQVVMEDLVRAKGDGGVIALDREGTVTMPFNSQGMYRGTIGEDGVPRVAIYREPLAASAVR
ncbi:MAG: isoaspartyl peptidase/L-asparaginase family protein [Kofleriaceae bacterium]